MTMKHIGGLPRATSPIKRRGHANRQYAATERKVHVGLAAPVCRPGTSIPVPGRELCCCNPNTGNYDDCDHPYDYVCPS
jgi:hypothetical protein